MAEIRHLSHPVPVWMGYRDRKTQQTLGLSLCTRLSRLWNTHMRVCLSIIFLTGTSIVSGTNRSRVRVTAVPFLSRNDSNRDRISGGSPHAQLAPAALPCVLPSGMALTPFLGCGDSCGCSGLVDREAVPYVHLSKRVDRPAASNLACVGRRYAAVYPHCLSPLMALETYGTAGQNTSGPVA